MAALRSKDNPRVRRWRALVEDARARRRERCCLIEGEHLVGAFLARGGRPRAMVATEAAAADPALARLLGARPVIVSPAVFRAIADTGSPAGIAAEIALPQVRLLLAEAPGGVLLDGIQDAGNVGAILRSAAAFGIGDVVLGPGCADPWSPKVLRAGMGAHFALRLETVRDARNAVEEFGGLAVCTVPRAGVPLRELDMGRRILWIFGAEGQGIGAALAAQVGMKVTIPMPGEAESLNVAAAAAICFYEFSRRGARS